MIINIIQFSSMPDRHVILDNSGDVPVGISEGECPQCGSRVVWAQSVSMEGSPVLLDPLSPIRVFPVRGRTLVVVSAIGSPRVVETWLYQLHSCPPGYITESIGFYDTSVLSVSCPVVLCHARPGELCTSTRYEILLRPHGSRIVATENMNSS